MESSRQTIPTAYGRALRDIFVYHNSFKAEEWSSWLIYYAPPLLFNRMHPDVYRHFMKLVIAVEISIDYSIEYQQVDRIRKLLVEYVSEYEDLYYRREQGRVSACLSTFHFLLHLADNILDCGPSWV